MAESKYQLNWKTWVFGGLPVVLTVLGAMFPEQAKALGTKIVEQWDWVGPLLAAVAFVVFVVLVFCELCQIRRAGDKTNRRSRKTNRSLRKMSRRVREVESQLRDQKTRTGAAVDRIETLERKIIKSDD